MAKRLALYIPDQRSGSAANPFGLRVANLGLQRALVRHGGFEQVDVLTNKPASLEALSAELLEGRPGATRLATDNILNVQASVRAGTLLRGSGDLGELAWLRRRTASDSAYSLVGLIHTIAPPSIREHIGAAAIAPVQPWDALICTSPSVQQAMRQMFEEWTGHLAERFAGSRPAGPELPLIPLGVDAQAMAALADRPAVRTEARGEYGLGTDDILVLWVGRLSFFEKAFPQPMFRAVEEAARATGRRVHFALAGWFPTGEAGREQFEAAAHAYAPSVTVHFVDGNDRTRVGGLWAAADVFLSLVDNIQETFGLTPVEAMAAGLPVVVSDWDGYRFTVRDGCEGFLIPTLIGPPDRFGSWIAARHSLSIDPYQAYVGTVAQHTAVHVGKAAEALASLIRSPDLRRRMGEAGRRSARERFDWPVVAAQVHALVDELAAVRAAAPAGSLGQPSNPLRGDPFRDFAGFATTALSPDMPLAVRPGVGPEDLARAGAVQLDSAFGAWRATLAECAEILAAISAGDAPTVGALAARFPDRRHWQVELAVVWMAKLGLIDWLPAQR